MGCSLDNKQISRRGRTFYFGLRGKLGCDGIFGGKEGMGVGQMWKNEMVENKFKNRINLRVLLLY